MEEGKGREGAYHTALFKAFLRVSKMSSRKADFTTFTNEDNVYVWIMLECGYNLVQQNDLVMIDINFY